MPIAPKWLGATDFKFGMQVFRDNNTDMTLNIFLQKRRGQGRVTANFPTPPLFEAPARGNPLECRDDIWRQKTRIVGLPDGEEIMTFDMTSSFLPRDAL